MSTTKKRGASAPRPDRQSKKRSGVIKQTLRLSVGDNKILREAASLDGFSISFWASRALLTAARARIAQEEINTQMKEE